MQFPKHLIFLTILLTTCLLSCNQAAPGKLSKPAPDTRIEMGLKGDFKRLTENTWEDFDSTAQVSEILSRIPQREQRWDFNAAGQKTDFKDWKLGKRLNWISYRYDDFGRLQHWHSIDAMERQDQTVEYEYNAVGSNSEIQTFNLAGEMTEQVVFFRDEEGREIRNQKRVYFTDAEENQQVNIYETITSYKLYQGKPYKKSRTTLNDTLISESRFLDGKPEDIRTFYPNGNTQQIISFPDGKYVFGIITSEYDENDEFQTAQEEFLNEKDQVYRIIKKDLLDQVLFWEVREFDDHGQISQSKQAYSTFVGEGQSEIPADTLHPTIQRFEYKYDSLGNWTQKLSFENGKMTEVRFREFAR